MDTRDQATAYIAERDKLKSCYGHNKSQEFMAADISLLEVYGFWKLADMNRKLLAIKRGAR